MRTWLDETERAINAKIDEAIALVRGCAHSRDGVCRGCLMEILAHERDWAKTDRIPRDRVRLLYIGGALIGFALGLVIATLY